MPNKVKVEAEVTTKKNVSSGIGKGFGITIGVVLGIIVVMVGCSILIGIGAKNSENEISPLQQSIEQNQQQAVQEITAPIEEAQQKVDDSLNQFSKEMQQQKEELEGKEAVNAADLFKSSKSKNTQNGVTLSIDDYKIEIKGTDFAKITKIKFTILNEGTDETFANVKAFLWDSNDDIKQKSAAKAEISVDGWVESGKYKTVEAPVNIAFNDIALDKTLKLVVYTGIYRDFLVGTETTFNAKT